MPETNGKFKSNPTKTNNLKYILSGEGGKKSLLTNITCDFVFQVIFKYINFSPVA